ncbi:hypothetical protein LJC71_09840 [Desulfosarcina sp. OttesenSCG-928-A07]|nr:hypothetical protein [Desulfosarcina sp. OttesenSCG-928-A07]
MGYDKRREKRLRSVKLLYAVLVAAAMVITGAVLPDAIYQLVAQQLSLLLGWPAFIEWMTGVLDSRYAKWFYLAGVGFVIGFCTRSRVVNPLYARFLEEFDDATFHPMSRAKAYDALWGADVGGEDAYALPFVLPQKGRLFIAWVKLRQMVAAGVERAEKVKKEQNSEQSMFGWGLVVGPSGIGKSRLAVELARHLRCETRFDDPIKENPLPSSRWKRRLVKFSSWWRVQVRGDFCDPEDPWDTGWLRPTSESIPSGRTRDKKKKKQTETFTAHDTRTRVAGELAKGLEKWRPRRPTLILLDDPHQGDTSAAINIFQENAKAYRHPVILLIVSHEVPSDLRLCKTRSTGKDIWEHQGGFAGMLGYPIDLGVTQWFSPQEIRRIVAHAPPPKITIGNNRDEDIAKFIKKTTGHPFLVELGFDGLRQGIPLENISRKVLLAERVKRIKEAFDRYGLKKDNDREIMMVATIAGSRDQPVTLAAFKEEYAGISFDTEALCNLFPHEARENLLHAIPPIHPAIIGEAFVRALSQEISPFSLKNAVAKAWKMNADETLGFSLRVGFIENDPLSEAISVPPENLGVDPAVLVAVYAKAGILLPLEGRPGTTRHNQAMAMTQKAKHYIARLSDEKREQALDDLIFLPVPGARATYQWVRIEAWWELTQILLAKYIGAETFSAAVFSQRLEAIQKIARENIGRFRTLPGSMADGLRHTLLACDGDRLREICLVVHSVYKKQGRCRAVYFWFARALSGSDHLHHCFKKAYGDDDAALMQAVIFHTRSAEDFSRFLQHILSGLSHYPLSRNRKLAGIHIIKQLCRWDLPKENSGHFHQLINDLNTIAQAITMPGASRPVPQKTGLAAYQHLGYIAERIAASFSEDRDFQYALAITWKHYAWAASFREDVDLCKDCVEHVSGISVRFPEDGDFQRELAETWRHYAYAASCSEDVDLCKDCVEYVNGISALFPEDRDFQYQLAIAWRYYAFAAANAGNLALCKECLACVEKISARFPEDRDFQFELAETWRVYAYAAACSEDVDLCKDCVEYVNGISVRFPGDQDFQYELARTWRHYAYAAAKADNLTLCKECLERVESISVRFPEDRKLQTCLHEVQQMVLGGM